MRNVPYQNVKTITLMKLHVSDMNVLKTTMEEITCCTCSHSIEKHHDNVTQENFKIIAKNFKNNK